MQINNTKAYDTPAIVLRKIGCALLLRWRYTIAQDFFGATQAKSHKRHAIGCAIHCTKRLAQQILRNTIAGVS